VKRALPRRILGAVILLISTLPIFRVLIAGDTVDSARGDFSVAQANARIASASLEYALWGTITALLLGLLAALLIRPHRLRSLLRWSGRGLDAVPVGGLAVVLGGVSTTLAALTNRLIYGGLFTDVDEIASTLHARYLAEGLLAGPLPGLSEAWLIPNMFMVDAGWVSQFPAGHLLVLAGATKAGATWLAGPILLGVFVAMSTLSLARILPDRPVPARVASLALAFSPLLIFIGGGVLSHTTAGAAGATALYAGLRARDGAAPWALLAGAAVGLMVTSRPWIGLVLGSVATLGVWLPSLRSGADRHRPRWLVERVAWTAAGGAPFAFVLGWFNSRLFGSPGTLGYLAAFGERHRLGFHDDPWGYHYGLSEALGFTSSDLISFGIQILETPLPLGALIGIWLLVAHRLPRGAGLLATWALLPVAANFVYWFHDVRMLYEAAPAWIGLGVLAVAGLGEMRGGGEGRIPSGHWILSTVLVSIGMAAVMGVPNRAESYRWTRDTLDRVSVPEIPDAERALIFVHTSWNERLSARLQGAAKMRQDSVITALRRNTTCALQRYADAREARVRRAADVSLPEVDLTQRAGVPPDIVRAGAPESTTLRTRPDEPFPPPCLRELRADRFGAVALAPLLWQGALPGIDQTGPLFLRDLGPEKNERLRSFFPERTPWVFVPRAEGAPPELVDYDEAMFVLWGAAPDLQDRGGSLEPRSLVRIAVTRSAPRSTSGSRQFPQPAPAPGAGRPTPTPPPP